MSAVSVDVLALDPYHGGSHAAVLDGWCRHSRHRIDRLTLPPHHWKWRLRHGAWTLARACSERPPPQALWTTDLLDLASWRGLLPSAWAQVPVVLYFHENQLTYPDPRRSERDLHFAFTNLLAAGAADVVWWNSTYHRDDCLAAARSWLGRMPDHRPDDLLRRIAVRSVVRHPGIAAPESAGPLAVAPVQLAWIARFEADKDPEALVGAIDRLLATPGLPDWQLSLLGGDAAQAPSALQQLAERLGPRLRQFGYVADAAVYRRLVAELDLVCSTARHEFFGLAVMEAVAAGARPILPRRVVYPELYAECPGITWYGDADELAPALARTIRATAASAGTAADGGRAERRHWAESFHWCQRVVDWDDGLAQIAATGRMGP